MYICQRGSWAGVGVKLLIKYSFDDVYQYTTHWLLLYQGIIMLLFYAFVDFYLFYDRHFDMQI